VLLKKLKKKKTRNRFEYRIESQLRRAKAVFEYETEHIPYVLARHYIPDFIITTPTGRVYIECKGYLRPEHKSKMVAVKRQHPEIDLRILFYSLNKTYIKWAERNGFRWAIAKLPKDWLRGL
jgi:predicted nuclease of restriction endonuclease-like RecB superfamily